MFVKERVAAMKKLEDAREKARMAAELSKRGKAMAVDGHPISGDAINTSSSDVHSSSSAVSSPEVPPITVKKVIRVGPPGKGDHTGGKSATYSGSTGGGFHISNEPNLRRPSIPLSPTSPSHGTVWQVDAASRTKATAAAIGIRPPFRSSRRPEHIAYAGEQSCADHSAPSLPSQTTSSALYMMQPVPLMNTVLSSGRYALNSPNPLSSELDDRKIRKKIDRLTKENRDMQEKLSSHHKVMELVVKKMGDIQTELQFMRTGSLSDPPDDSQSVFKDVADSYSCGSSEDSTAEEEQPPALLIADLQEHVVSLEAQLQLLMLDMKDEGQSLCCFTYS